MERRDFLKSAAALTALPALRDVAKNFAGATHNPQYLDSRNSDPRYLNSRYLGVRPS